MRSFMRLSRQHFNSSAAASSWLKAQGCGQLQADSRQIQKGDGFIAWCGANHDARKFTKAALDNGAAACLLDVPIQAQNQEHSLEAVCGSAIDTIDQYKIATVSGLKNQAGQIAADFYGQPSLALLVVAMTGTNGKTSCTFWLAQALAHVRMPEGAPSIPCGLIGTLGVGAPTPNTLEHTGLTTPDCVALQRYLHRFVNTGFKACALEASSIGIAEGRLDATEVRIAVFTNFTQDHLDYHSNTVAYWAEKARLFGWKGLRSAVVNIDDAQGASLLKTLEQEKPDLDLWSISLQGQARLQAKDLYDTGDGLCFRVLETSKLGAAQVSAHGIPVQTRMHGRYNALNLLIVIACMRALGVALDTALATLAHLRSVPGRMERVPDPATNTATAHVPLPVVFVDYAHTPDALAQTLSVLRPIAQSRGGKLWCVFGCGGNRDAGKRPLMGRVADTLADMVLVTSDNPRHENPRTIAADIVRTLSRQPLIELDRRAAIAYILHQADAADVVLIAGKGHETYQEIAGIKYPLDDKQCAQELLEQRQAAALYPRVRGRA